MYIQVVIYWRYMLNVEHSLSLRFACFCECGVCVCVCVYTDTAVTKNDMIEWIRAAKAELMQGDAPFYLGIHISNLVRDGILASFQADLSV